MNTSLISVVLLLTAQPVADAEETLETTFESQADLTPQGTIDELVFGNLKKLEIEPAKVCSDEVFVRRAYLDVIGTLPTAAEAQEFLSDSDSKKRSVLIDRLLERDEFADYWAMKWCDLLRVKAEFPINLWPNGVQAYHRWIHTSIKGNMPYDRFVREILTANGSNFRDPPVNFYRAVQSQEPEAIAQAVALTFMGSRAENWPEDRLPGMAAFFSQIGYKQTGEWKEEIVFFDALKAADSDQISTILPDGTRVQLPPDKDPREVFADWMIAPGNEYFAGNIVNRIWYWLLGRGIVHEPDDIRPDNPPANPELLAYLEKELVDAQYDLKHIYRLILNSKTYQLSSIPRTDHPEAEAHFAYYPLRRLDAEVLIDALCQITGTTEEYSSPIPEPFTFIPENQRSIALPDGSITSSFLEMFGRPPRDTGFVSERNNRSTAGQRLHMLNSSHIREKIERSGRLRLLMQSSRRNPLKAVTGLYLTILSRPPTEEELKIVRDYSQSGAVTGQEALADLTWALINSAEFLYRH
ncbi:MAG: DUF1553 domain-containing protein [Planctomycetes bacterium]|nr:DUF1553 domain-containing protein [Planctomycetota bacterium]MBL7038520.1 DUF1553 domain-containing protein [Pirellulaceae bacterium]